MNHHESTKEERVSESSAMEVCDIETAVILEDSSEEELILDELRRLIQNRTTKNAFYSGVLFGLMTGLGAMLSLIYLRSQYVLLRAIAYMFWGLPGLLTVTTMSITFTARTLLLNIFRASYESRTLGNESITHSVVSFVDVKIVNGMVVGLSLTLPWVFCNLSSGWLWMVLVTQAFPIGLLIHNSITDNRIMNRDADFTLELVKELA